MALILTPSHLFITGITGDTTATPTITYTAAGSYSIQHQVLDNMPDKPALKSQFPRVRVHDDDDPPIKCLISWDLNEEGGFSTRIIVYEPLPLSVLPDYARVIVWTDKPLTGTHKTGRDHIIADGLIKRDVSETGAGSGRTIEKSLELELISPLAALGELPGFSKVLERTATPDAWHQVRALTVKRAMLVLITRYTNVADLYDLAFDGFSDAAYSLFFLQKNTPLEQWRELAASRGARVVCDLTGRIEVQGLLSLVPLANRGAITTTLTISGRDASKITVERQHKRSTETFRAKGFTAGATAETNVAAFARAPASPGRGNQSPSVERLIVDNTPHLFEQCALYYAAADNVYFKPIIGNSGYEQLHAPRINLTLPGSYWGMFQNYREYVKFDLPTNITLRQTDLTAFRWQVVSANVNVGERGVAEVTVELQAETYAHPSVSVDDTPPSTGEVIAPVVTLPPFTTIPPTIAASPDRIPGWTNQLPVKLWGVSYTDPISIARSVSIDYGTYAVTWEDLGDLGITGTAQWALSNPHDYKQKLILTTTGLWRIPNLWAAIPTASLVATNAQMFGDSSRIGHYITKTHNDKRGWIAVLCGNNVVAISMNDGATWTTTAFDNDTPGYSTVPIVSTDNKYLGTLRTVGWNSSANGVLYAIRYLSGGNIRLCRSADWGLAWNVKSTLNYGSWERHALDIPYMRAPNVPNKDDGSLVMYMGSAASMRRSTNGGTSFPNVFPVINNIGVYTLHFANNPITSFTHDGNAIAYSAIRTQAPGDGPYTMGSIDGGTTVEQYRYYGLIQRYGMNVHGFAAHDGFLVSFANDGATPVSFTTDRGASGWHDITPAFWTGRRVAYL